MTLGKLPFMAFLYEATKMQWGKKALQDKRQVLNIKKNEI